MALRCCGGAEPETSMVGHGQVYMHRISRRAARACACSCPGSVARAGAATPREHSPFLVLFFCGVWRAKKGKQNSCLGCNIVNLATQLRLYEAAPKHGRRSHACTAPLIKAATSEGHRCIGARLQLAAGKKKADSAPSVASIPEQPTLLAQVSSTD